MAHMETAENINYVEDTANLDYVSNPFTLEEIIDTSTDLQITRLGKAEITIGTNVIEDTTYYFAYDYELFMTGELPGMDLFKTENEARTHAQTLIAALS